MTQIPASIERLWVVVRPGGERYYLDKEPIEGINTWAKGVDATIIEYQAVSIIHRPPAKKKGP